MKNRIKEFRARLDLTQEELAKKVGIRRETILHIEKNRLNPSIRMAYQIAKALGTTLDDLFIFEEEKK